MIRVLYFGWVRELVGADGDDVAEDGPIAVSALVDMLEARSPRHGEALKERGRLRYALNQQLVEPEAQAQAGDEVAVFPPVTGG